MVAIGIGLRYVNAHRTIAIDSAVRSTRRGDYSLIAVSENSISFQKDGSHKYQYYFSPPLPPPVVEELKSAVREARAGKHQVFIMDSRKAAGDRLDD